MEQEAGTMGQEAGTMGRYFHKNDGGGGAPGARSRRNGAWMTHDRQRDDRI